jgi:hypothetical protein
MCVVPLIPSLEKQEAHAEERKQHVQELFPQIATTGHFHDKEQSTLCSCTNFRSYASIRNERNPVALCIGESGFSDSMGLMAQSIIDPIRSRFARKGIIMPFNSSGKEAKVVNECSCVWSKRSSLREFQRMLKSTSLKGKF